MNDDEFCQRCICQESEVLARIALRSLGRFVTSMHKTYPDSPTITRQQPGTAAADASEEGKEVSAWGGGVSGWLSLCRAMLYVVCPVFLFLFLF